MKRRKGNTLEQQGECWRWVGWGQLREGKGSAGIPTISSRLILDGS